MEPWLEEQPEERLQALIDSSPVAIVEFGLDTRVRLWNPAAERIFGWSREEMVGRGGLPMAPPAQRAESEKLFARVLAGESLNDYETVRAGRVPVPVDVSDIRDERLPEPIEAAAYYLIAEALTNVTKYAQAATVRVRVDADVERVVVEVSDDGIGGADPTGGSGLRGLADRVEALGGSLEIASPPGEGTTLRAVIPRGMLMRSGSAT